MEQQLFELTKDFLGAKKGDLFELSKRYETQGYSRIYEKEINKVSNKMFFIDLEIINEAPHLLEPFNMNGLELKAMEKLNCKTLKELENLYFLLQVHFSMPIWLEFLLELSTDRS